MKINETKFNGVVELLKIDNVKDVDILEGVPLGFYPMKYANALIRIKKNIYGG